MKRFILLILTASLLMGCDVNAIHDDAKSAVETYGFTDVQLEVTFSGWLACGEDDVWRYSFTAKRDNVPVTGSVCSGWFKGWTVRIQ